MTAAAPVRYDCTHMIELETVGAIVAAATHNHCDLKTTPGSRNVRSLSDVRRSSPLQASPRLRDMRRAAASKSAKTA
jgi:hypothetical protein